MSALSPAPPKYPCSRPFGSDPLDVESIHRFDVEFTGSRFQIRRVDTIASYNRELRELVRLKADDVAQELALVSGDLTPEQLALYLGETAIEGKKSNLGRRGVVTGWSRKSRSNLLRTLAGCALPGHWAMWTLTVPADWFRYAPHPDDAQELLRTFVKRYEREFGEMSAVWKLEFQRRGAFHYHIGFRMPEGYKHVPGAPPDSVLREWGNRAWHEIVVHPGRWGVCPGDTCPEIWHRRKGCDLDTRYADRIQQAGKTFASYFAKHKTWKSKAYQNVPAGRRLREVAAVMAFMSGVPVPAKLLGGLEPSSTQKEQMRQLFRWMARPGSYRADPRWGDIPELIEAWDCPGRWWGRRKLPDAATAHGEFTAEELDAARLVARKVVARRSWRYEERDGASPVFMRRSLSSLHWTSADGTPAGFWLLAANPSEFRWWFLEQVRIVSRLRGRGRALYLSQIVEPGGREQPPGRLSDAVARARVLSARWAAIAAPVSTVGCNA